MQWWLNTELTEAINKMDEEGNQLHGVGYYIKEPDGVHAYVMVNTDSEIVEFEPDYEAILERLQFRKAAQKQNKRFFLPPMTPNYKY